MNLMMLECYNIFLVQVMIGIDIPKVKDKNKVIKRGMNLYLSLSPNKKKKKIKKDSHPIVMNTSLILKTV